MDFNANPAIQERSAPSARAARLEAPPNSAGVESALLGSILISNEAIGKAIETLDGADDFYQPFNRKLYQAALNLYERSEPIDIRTLSEEARKNGLTGQIEERLVDMIDSTPTAANAPIYARIVKDKASLRRLITLSNELSKLAYDEIEEVDAILDQAESMIFALSQKRIKKALMPIDEVVKKGMETIQRLFDSDSILTGLPTGYKDLDDKTAGLQRAELIIVAGRPSMGKTALALNIAQNLAKIDEKAVIAIFSLEMSAEQLALRMLCSEARVSGHKIRTGFLPKRDWPKLGAAASRLYETNIMIDDTPALSPLDIRAKARRLKSERKRLDLVIIDYLQLMSLRHKVESRVLEVSEITRALKQLAKELDAPVIAISQLSRKVEDRADRRPQLADLRESGAIEQDADLVMFVFREEFYSPKKEGAENVADIIIAKQRNGPLGDFKLTFLKDFTRFENFAQTPFVSGAEESEEYGESTF